MKNGYHKDSNRSRLRGFAIKFSRVRYTNYGFTAQCPSHDDKHNSLSVKEDVNGRLLIKCHAGCDSKDVLQAVGLSFRDLFPPAGEQVVLQSCKPPQGVPSIAAVYPYSDEQGDLLYEVVRTDPKGFYQRRPDGKGGYVMGLGNVRRVLYGLDSVVVAVRFGRTILLCEGEKDADAVNALGLDIYATTAPMGAMKWQEDYTASLAGGQVIICPDNDDAGERHLWASGDALLAAGCDVRVSRVSVLCPALAGKKGADVYDYLTSALDARAALIRLVEEAVPFSEAKFDGMGAYLLDGFQKEIEYSSGEQFISTGFPSLDTQLGGGLYTGLYVLGSISSLGKTAFIGQVAMSIAAQGRKVLFFSLEMGRAEITARCLTRMLFEKDPARFGNIGVNEILRGKISFEVNQEIKTFADLAAFRNLCIIEGDFSLSVDAIRERVLQIRRTFGVAPVVFVDYLQIISAFGMKLGEKQAVDENILALKRLSREMGIPVFAVSSFNRQNYTSGATYSAFKESGAIEYSADVVLALQADGVEELSACGMGDPSRRIEQVMNESKRHDVRALELITLKNRRGMAYGRVRLDFYAGRYFFSEGTQTWKNPL